MSVSTVRGRTVLTTFALIVAGILLRAQLSSALVTRGDSLAYWGERSQARAMYARALVLDRTNRVAADRYAFDASISNNASVIRSGVTVASRYLSRNPDDGILLMDRALCYQHEGTLARAIADFQRAGRIEHDPRAFMFAALDERTLRHSGRARRLLKDAIALDPTFQPARVELART